MKKYAWILLLCILGAVIYLGKPAETPVDDEALTARLANLPVEDLIKETEEAAGKAADPEALIYHASALAQRLDELTEEQILSLAADKEKPEYFRVVMLELCGKLKENGKLKDTAVLVRMYADTSDLEAVRVRVGYLIDNSKLLEEVFWQDDGDVAFQALKALRLADPDSAWTAAGVILDNHADEPAIKVKAAIKAKAAILADDSAYSKEKPAFIEQCALIREGLAEDDTEMQLTIVFALTELRDMDALALILAGPEPKWGIHAFAIYENMALIEETLEAGASEKDLETAVAAVCAYPEEDGRLYALVANAVENATFYTQSEKEAVLAGMVAPEVSFE